MANVACGFHAGDSALMLKSVRMAKAKGVKIGAHPGLPGKLIEREQLVSRLRIWLSSSLNCITSCMLTLLQIS